ncbi:MAG: hypothetical protein LBU73_04770 [Helicobacteraceae bacterium]|jgi:hypothetical protein|nr:hypothetical protein [Helicobacteraceae bacterium]
MKFFALFLFFCCVILGESAPRIAPTLKPSLALKVVIENGEENFNIDSVSIITPDFAENSVEPIWQKEQNLTKKEEKNSEKFYTDSLDDPYYEKYGRKLSIHEQRYIELVEKRKREYFEKLRAIGNE